MNVWGEAKDIPNCGSASGTLLSAPDPQHVGTAGLRHAQCQQNQQQAGRASVAAVLSGLPPHPAGGLVSGSRPGFGPVV